MITIRYIDGDLQGTCTYQIKINDQAVCQFSHHNPDGFTECLHKAADAVELSEWAEHVLRDDAKGG